MLSLLYIRIHVVEENRRNAKKQMCMTELNVIQFVILQANWNIQTKGYIFKKGVNAQ